MDARIAAFTIFNQDPFDFLDPRTWEIEEPKPDDTYYISLSDRVDCQVALDWIDYVDLKKHLWCHTFGSGKRDPILRAPQGVDKIYARRSIPIPGVTSSGRPRYGTEWLHRTVTERAYGPPPSLLHVSDHLDGNSLNCKRSNLRWATLSQNAKNKYGSEWIQRRFNFGSGYQE